MTPNLRWTAPPNWPPVPPGWSPPPGWQPDPAWPELPAGWQFWQEEVPPDPVLASVGYGVEPAPSPQPNNIGGQIVGGIVGTILLAALVIFGWEYLSSHSTLSGNGKDAVVTVDAPAGECWSANIGNATQEACGPASFPVHDDLGLFSSNVQKREEGGWTVTISIVQDGRTLATNSTSAEYGIAQVIAS